MSANNIEMSKIKQVMRMMLQLDARGRRPANRKIADTVGLYKGTLNELSRFSVPDCREFDAHHHYVCAGHPEGCPLQPQR